MFGLLWLFFMSTDPDVDLEFIRPFSNDPNPVLLFSIFPVLDNRLESKEDLHLRKLINHSSWMNIEILFQIDELYLGSSGKASKVIFPASAEAPWIFLIIQFGPFFSFHL